MDNLNKVSCMQDVGYTERRQARQMEEKLVNIMNDMAEYLNISQLAVRIDEKLHLFYVNENCF